MILTALVLGLCAAPIPQDDDEVPDGNTLVRTELLADHAAIPPGGTLTLAVRLKIEPRWHIYWENPGDSGMPTRVKFTLPDGWESGPLRFPSPERHEDAGDIVTFIHEGEVVLLSEVRVPADARPGAKVTLGVEASWLVCTDICVPGSGKAAVEIAVAAAAQSVHADVFAAARARLPRPWSELTRSRVSWSGEQGAPRLTVVVPGAKSLELFPLDVRPLKLVARTVDAGQSGATLKADLEFRPKAPEDAPRLRAVLWVKTDAGEAAYLLDAAPPARDAAR